MLISTKNLYQVAVARDWRVVDIKEDTEKEATDLGTLFCGVVEHV